MNTTLFAIRFARRFALLRFDATRALLSVVLSSPPVKAYNNALRWIKTAGPSSSGLWPQDALNEVFLTPPSSLDEAALAVAGAALGCVDTSRLDLPDIPLPDGADFVPCPPDLIDGTEGIRQAAKQVSPSSLREAARELTKASSSGAAREGGVSISLPPLSDVPPNLSKSGGGKTLAGYGPLLFPLPPSAAVLGFFVALIQYSIANNGVSE